jgi:hypothetical protein
MPAGVKSFLGRNQTIASRAVFRTTAKTTRIREVKDKDIPSRIEDKGRGIVNDRRQERNQIKIAAHHDGRMLKPF